MEFGTWYQINCQTEDSWREDFARIRDTGFDFVVLWNMPPYPPGTWEGDVRPIVHRSAKTLRALDEVGRAGLKACLGVWHPYCIGKVPAKYRLRWADGTLGSGPNIFNEQWVRRAWLPYVRKAAGRFAGHRAYRGLYFDDTFPVLPGRTSSYLSYSAADHTRVTRSMLLADVRRVVDCGLEIAGDKPFQFHTWFADAVRYRPMAPALLRAVIECAVERGAKAIEIYTFKVHDWRLGPARGRTTGALPCFREVSLKYNPKMLRCLKDLISRAR